MITQVGTMEELLRVVAGNSIFATMLVILWVYYNKAIEKKDDHIKEKDNELKMVNEKVLTAFLENSKALQNVTTAVDNNTKASEQLMDRVYKVLTDK